MKRTTLIVPLLLAVSVISVAAQFIATANVALQIGSTAAEVSKVQLALTGPGTGTTTLSCTPSLPAPIVNCSGNNVIVGANYTLIVIVLNSGTIPILTVHGQGLAVAIYPQVTFSSFSYVTLDTATTTLVQTTVTTSTLGQGRTWAFTIPFTVPADAVDGGTITFTVAAYG